MLFPLRLPPGVVKPGTVYDAKGRWYKADLIRWKDGVMQPVGGWNALSGAGSAQVDGPVRGMLAWRRNNGDAKLWLGTATQAFVYADGTLTDVTPVAGFTTGAVDASGNYWSRTEANTWQVDSYGEDVVACAWADGTILQYDSSAGGAMAAVTNAPTGCTGVVVTPERFLVALGASGDGRLVKWADQDDNTIWTAAATNQAGDFDLPGQGQILAGHRGRGETLIWTDVDLFGLRYIGGSSIYSRQKLGSNCGAISRRSMAVVGGWAMWMGQQNFYVYDGSVRAVPCEISDHVFTDLNRAQASKIWAMPLADFHEIWWFYPSSSATECDSVAIVNYNDGHWNVLSSFERTAGVDRAFLEYPIMADASGAVYFHEDGTTMADEGGSPSYTPTAESGPIELGNGDQVMHVRSIIPAEETQGDLDFSLIVSFYPEASETTNGPFTAANIQDARATGRQARLKLSQAAAGWRYGTPRLEVVPGGRR